MVLTKQLGEDLIRDRKPTGAIILRYFNPIGAHHLASSAKVPDGPPANLVPYITQTAGRAAREAHRVRHRLQYARWQLHPRLHPCGGPGPSPCGGLGALGLGTGDRCVPNVGTGAGNSVLEAVETFMCA